MITVFRSLGGGGWRGRGKQTKNSRVSLFFLSLSGLFHSLFLVEDEERHRCIGLLCFPTFLLSDKRKQRRFKIIDV